MKLVYKTNEVISMLAPIIDANDDIQEYVSEFGETLPEVLLKMLSDLDFVIRNAGEEAKGKPSEVEE